MFNQYSSPITSSTYIWQGYPWYSWNCFSLSTLKNEKNDHWYCKYQEYQCHQLDYLLALILGLSLKWFIWIFSELRPLLEVMVPIIVIRGCTRFGGIIIPLICRCYGVHFKYLKIYKLWNSDIDCFELYFGQNNIAAHSHFLMIFFNLFFLFEENFLKLLFTFGFIFEVRDPNVW